MLLIKTFYPTIANQIESVSNVVVKNGYLTAVGMGTIAFKPFEATLSRGFEGISIDGDQDIFIDVGTGFQSVDSARTALLTHTGPIELKVELHRGQSFKSISIGYYVDANPIDYLFNIGLPALLQRPWGLSRYLKPSQSIEGVNADRIVSRRDPIVVGNDYGFVSFDYLPLIVSTQNFYQGEEVPSIIIRVERYFNRRLISPIDFVLSDQALVRSVSECVDIEIEITIVASTSSDLFAGVDAVTQALSYGRVDAFPLGLVLGVVLTQSAMFDQSSNDVDFAHLPSATMKIVLVNVPVGASVDNMGFVDGFKFDRF